MGVARAAAGAMLHSAISVTTPGFNLHIVGLILIILGAISLLISIACWSPLGRFVEEEHANTPA
jgi:hypothetical protein